MFPSALLIAKNSISRNSCSCIQNIRFIATTTTRSRKTSKWIAPMFRELKRRNDRMSEKKQLPVERRSQYIDWNHDAEIYALGQRLGEKFDEKMLLSAMIDSSHLHHMSKLQKEHGLDQAMSGDKSNKYQFTEQQSSNAALALEGGNLVSKYCRRFVQRSWPSVPEEGISSIVDYLSGDESMAIVAQSFGIKDILLAEPYPPSVEVLADGARAVVGALATTADEERTEAFVIDFVAVNMTGKSLWDMWQLTEPQLTLENVLLKTFSPSEVEYRLVNRSGTNTLEAVYRVAVYAKQNFIGMGFGETVELASDQAALDGLARMFGATNAKPCLPFKLSLPPNYSKFCHKYSEDPNTDPVKLDNFTVQNSENIVTC